MSYNIPIPLNESRWQYQTASGGGLTVALVAGSGGSIILRSPQGKDVSYRYGGVGVGVGGSATALLFGLDPKLLALAAVLSSNPATSLIASSTVNRQLLQSAKGAVVMAGMNAGAQAGGAAAIYMGYLF